MTEHRLTQYRARVLTKRLRSNSAQRNVSFRNVISKAHPVAQRIIIPSVEYCYGGECLKRSWGGFAYPTKCLCYPWGRSKCDFEKKKMREKEGVAPCDPRTPHETRFEACVCRSSLARTSMSSNAELGKRIIRYVLRSSLVDPASSHMLVSKIKPCMSQCKPY